MKKKPKELTKISTDNARSLEIKLPNLIDIFVEHELMITVVRLGDAVVTCFGVIYTRRESLFVCLERSPRSVSVALMEVRAGSPPLWGPSFPPLEQSRHPSIHPGAKTRGHT